MTDYLFRFDDVLYAGSLLDDYENYGQSTLRVELRRFAIIRRTQKGAWILDRQGRRRFVLLTANKRYACETEQSARDSFVRRKQRQVGILSAQLRHAQYALAIIKGESLTAPRLVFA